jgi:hypothetical protein
MEKLKRIKFVIILVICGILVSCATTPKETTDLEKLHLLEQELSRWQSFKITGLADVHYQAFAVRRPAVIAMTEGKFRFDVLDSGFLGFGSGTVMSAFVDSENIQIRRPGSSRVESISLDGDAIELLKLLTHSWSDLLHNHKRTIVSQHYCTIHGVEIHFTEQMRIREISSVGDNVKIEFNYNRSEVLTDIIVTNPLFRRLNIHVDKKEFDNIVVNSLIRS